MAREKRDDLANLEVNAPEGYIGSKVLPKFRSMVQAGKFYYKDVVADSAAQTNRTLGAAPDHVTLASASEDFTCTEAFKRYRAPYEILKVLGGEANAQIVGAKAGKRSIMAEIEESISTALYACDENTVIDISQDTTANLLVTIVEAVPNIKACDGKTALVCGYDTFLNIMENTDVKAAIARASGALTPADLYAPETLARLLKIDAVLVGDKTYWGGGINEENTFALVKLPDPSEEAVFTDAQVGRLIVFYPAESQIEYSIEVAENNIDRGWDIDVLTHCKAMVLNPEGVQVIKF